jgi:class 3 adenylate cyclase
LQARGHLQPPCRAELHPDQQQLADLVERWFAELASKKLRRGAHRSVRALHADIRAWIETWNNPKPYSWTKTADQILDSIATCCTRISESRH